MGLIETLLLPTLNDKDGILLKKMNMLESENSPA